MICVHFLFSSIAPIQGAIKTCALYKIMLNLLVLLSYRHTFNSVDCGQAEYEGVDQFYSGSSELNDSTVFSFVRERTRCI